MNNIDRNPDYKKIYSIIKSRFGKTNYFCNGHLDETFFSLRVYETAKEIMSKLKIKVNRQEVLTAALLHDIGKTKLDDKKMFSETKYLKGRHDEWRKHAKLGVPIAKRILKRLGHSDEFTEEICYLVGNHDSRKELKEKTIELKVLQDADLISDAGYAAFIRPFIFGGQFQRDIIGTIKYIQKEVNRVVMPGMINLKVSKEMGMKKIKTEKKLIKEISEEIESDLL
jgi:putative nucleotidyltransferase with HDIG domain